MKDTILACLIALTLFEGARAITHSIGFALDQFNEACKVKTLFFLGIVYIALGLFLLHKFTP